MNTKLNFINRNKLLINNQNPKKVDAQKIIDYFKSLHPANRLKVGSPLYNLAIKQYNENIKNTLIRPKVPEWFCGKVNPATGELINQPTDEQLRASAGYALDPPQPPIITPTATSGNYLIDECLEGTGGLPGDPTYATCATGVDAREAEALVQEWLTSMESVFEARAEAENNFATMYSSAGGEGGTGAGVSGSPPGGASSITISFGSANSSRVSWGGGGATSSWSTIFMGHANVAGTVHLYRKVGGAWVGGKFEWFRPGSGSVGAANLLGGKYYQPLKAGDPIGIMLVSHDGSKKSNIASGTWGG